ncbi:MAG: nucleotidyltransferase domain-containing protein [Gammaproteobacteria bacterium]|nr:nucleotidyltransferase domain-containing protein [Gammaproteobacteria bacterium]
MLSLSENERNWLEQYRQAINARHPGKVVRIAIFGSKARGDSHKYSDVDVLVIVNDDSVKLKMSLQKIGCKLASNSLVLPGIVVYPEAQWEELKRFGSAFHESVEHEAVAVQ